MILVRPSLFAASVVAALLLAGCAGDRALRKSPDYRAGYNDGCASATDGNNDRKDAQSYAGNKAYRAGFRTGFGNCRPATSAGPNNGTGNVMGPPPLQMGGPGGATP